VTPRFDTFVVDSVLPTGAATEAKQDAGIALLSSLDTKTPAMSASVVDSLTFNGDAVTISTVGRSTVVVGSVGAIAALVVPQGTMDGVTWVNLYAYPVSGGNSVISLADGALYSVPVAGFSQFRITAAFWTSGSSTVTITASSTGRPTPSIGTVRTSQPTAFTNNQYQAPGLDNYGLAMTKSADRVLVEWGKAFRASSNFISTGAAPETPLLLIRNPAGSGKVMTITGILYSPPQTGDVEFRRYQGPTITATGTAVAISGARQVGQAAASGQIFSLPTASTFGTLVEAVHLQNTATPYHATLAILDPGNDMLITVQKSGAGVLTAVSVEHSEQP
jgi:hypothetical protein